MRASGVIISIDFESGVVTYTISSSAAEEAIEILEASQEQPANATVSGALVQNTFQISNVTVSIP